MVKRALLAIYTDGHFTELVRVARLLSRSKSYEPLVYFARLYPQKERDRATCRREGWAVVDHAEVPTHATAPETTPGLPALPRLARVKSLLRAAVVRLPFPFTVFRALFRQGQQLRQARAVVAEHKPDVLILAEDGVGYETATLIRAAHQRNVPSVIVPFTVANALEPAEAYFLDPAYHVERWTNRLAATVYPRWVYTHRGRRMLRMPAAQLLAKEWFGLAPPLPWIMNSGAADALTVESSFMETYYRREGLPENKLVWTGALYDDVLAENRKNVSSRRAELCAQLGLPAGRRIVVCALPPDQFSISGQQTDFPDYPAMVQWWVRALAELHGWNVVVRLHPRMDAAEHRYLEDWGARICEWDTAALVPLADLYVASVSATIRWAIACGIPVVNYDAYRLRWTDYADAPGVLRVEEKAEFVSIMRRLATDPAFYALVRQQQESDARRWGQLDGRAGSRILRLIETLEVRVKN